MEAEFLPVQADGSIFIHTLEFYKNHFAFPFCGSCKGLFVCVDATGEITVTPVGYVCAALFCDLCVMRKGDGCTVARPMIVEYHLLHEIFLPYYSVIILQITIGIVWLTGCYSGIQLGISPVCSLSNILPDDRPGLRFLPIAVWSESLS